MQLASAMPHAQFWCAAGELSECLVGVQYWWNMLQYHVHNQPGSGTSNCSNSESVLNSIQSTVSVGKQGGPSCGCSSTQLGHERASDAKHSCEPLIQCIVADWQADVCRKSAADSWTSVCSWGQLEARNQLSDLLCSCCALNVSRAAMSLATPVESETCTNSKFDIRQA